MVLLYMSFVEIYFNLINNKIIVLVASSQRNRLSAEHQGIDELRLMFEKWKEEEKAEQQVSLGLLSDFFTSGFVGDWILDTLNLSCR